MGRAGGPPVSAFLAAEVLRFQRVERQEKEREDELHALQSREARARRAPKGVDLEQLSVLLEGRGESVRSQSRAIVQRREEEDAPLHIKGRGTPAIVGREVAKAGVTLEAAAPTKMGHPLPESIAETKGAPPALVDERTSGFRHAM